MHRFKRLPEEGGEEGRGTGKTRRRLQALLAALLPVLFVLFGWPAGALAQQVLVSNLGQADFATASPIASLLGVFDHAQQFTTGSNSAGYRLNSVEIEFGRLDAGFPFSVSIRTNASGSPGTVVGTLANPSYTAFTTDTVLKFTAAGDGIALAASTSYFLVLDVTGDSGSNFATWRVTTSMSEDSGGASGWSIADLHRFRQNVADAAWTNNLVRSSLKLRINGSAVTLPTVTIARVASPVTEGAAARFTVSRTGATTAALAVQLSVSENSAGGRNFVASTNEGAKSVSIPMGSASAVYSVATVGDAIDEPDGAVTVTVASGSGYTVGSPSTATVTVNDDDLPVVTIVRDASSVTEGTSASFTVTRAGLTTAALPVSLTVADAAGSDFVASEGEGADTVTIAAGQASVAYRVATVADNVDEPNGVVTVTLTAGTGYTVGTQGSAGVTVNDDDVPGVLINGSGSDISASVGENGGSSTYAVQLATQPSHNVTLTVSSATANAATVNKAGGSAGGTQTLTFTPSGAGAWNVAQTITVTGYDNSRDDANNQRSSVITHTAASSDTGYEGISGPRVTVTVIDDDTPELTVSAQGGAVRVNENAAATIVVTSSIPVDGSIDHGQPTVSAGGSVSASATTIAGGRAVNSYTVTATDNNQDEPDWSVTTGIGAGSGYTLGTPSSITLTVRDNDPTIVSLAGGGTLFEGETAAFTVTLGRALAADETIDVPLAVSGVNVSVDDWNLALDSGQGLNAGVSLAGPNTATPQVSFTNAGARTATLLLTAAAGSGGKTLRVELGPDGAGANGFDRTSLATNVGGGANPHPTARAFSLTVTADAVINDRDFVVFSPRQGAASGPVLPEGEQRTLIVHRIAFTPDRSGLHIPNAWGFRLCFTGTATPGADYQVRHSGGPARLDQEGCTRANNAADGTAVPAGLDRVPFYVALLHDDLDEAKESVIATLSRTVNTGVSGDGYSETRFTIEEPPLIDKVRHYTTEIARGWDHVLRWRRALHALSDGAEGEGPAMTAAEAQGYADQDGTRWAPVVAALTNLEGAARSPQRSDSEAAEGNDSAATACAATSADLVETVRGYYELNRNRADRGYGENWLRVLIAFRAETHATLMPYTAAEARASERKWPGWRPVREELERLEVCNDQPGVTVARDAPRIGWDRSEGLQEEAADADFNLKLTSTIALAADLTVAYRLSGTATCGTDYRIAGADCAAGTGRFVLPAGTAASAGVLFPITVVKDSDADHDETIILALEDGTHHDLGAHPIFTGTLVESTGEAAFSLTGVPVVGGTLTVEKIADDPDGNGTFSYEWQFRASSGETWNAAAAAARGCGSSAVCAPTHSDQSPTLGGGFRVMVSYTDGHKVATTVATDPVGPMQSADTLTVSIDDAKAAEGDAVVFTVRLSKPAPDSVTVVWQTRESGPASARKGVDYEDRQRGETVFRKGQSEGPARVRTFADAHDDGGETFEMVITSASSAGRDRSFTILIADGVAIGTITNDDPLPAAYLARFGRTVAEQALDGIAGRLAAPRTPGMQGTLAGYALGAAADPGPPFAPAAPDRPTLNDVVSGAFGPPPDPHAARALADIARGFGGQVSSPESSFPGAWDTDSFGDPFGGFDDSPPGPSPTMTAQEALLGSRFALTAPSDATGGSAAVWGRASQHRFDGAERGDGTAITLDGAVTTGMLGADYARGDWLVGLALTHSTSEGDYASVGEDRCSETDGERCDGAVRAGDGTVDASLTAAVPYASLKASERLTLWGAAGVGTGEVTVRTAMDARYRADTNWTMAAAGIRGDLLGAPRDGALESRSGASGFALALTSDALWARTASEKTRGLAASESDVTRVRFGLEGRWRIAMEDDGHLTPTLELGARHDGGDAETGVGVEFGGGLAWSAPALGLSLDLSGRTLIAHEDDDLKDRGFSAAFAFDPAPETERGPSFSLRQDFGGQAEGGLDALFTSAPLADRTASDAPARWTMEAAWGVPVLKGRFTGSPHAGLGLAPGARDYRLGWRLTPQAATAPDLSLGVTATHRESDTTDPEHRVGVEATIRW